MSIRTIIEINHDHLTDVTRAELLDLLNELRGSLVTGLLNRNDSKPFSWSTGVRILAQRHHSDELTLKTRFFEVKA